MRISDWSSDVCSSDLARRATPLGCRVSRRSGEADEGQDGNDDDDKADEVDNLVHREAFSDVVFIAATTRHGLGFRYATKPDATAARSEERRVGKECVSTRRSRWAT